MVVEEGVFGGIVMDSASMCQSGPFCLVWLFNCCFSVGGVGWGVVFDTMKAIKQWAGSLN